MGAKFGGEKEGNRARFTGTRGSQNRKVFAQQVIDLDHSRNAWILLNAANPKRFCITAFVGLAELLLIGRQHRITEAGIATDPAFEA